MAIGHNVSQSDPHVRRLLWRCRRGMKELDILLERYARTHLPGASEEQRCQFEQFLQLPDPVLADYLLGCSPPQRPEWAQLVGRILGRPASPSV